MAQTTNAMSFKSNKIEISTNGTAYTDISGFANSVDVGGGDRQAGEAYTYDGDTAIIAIGKREPVEVTVKVVYTEGTGDPFETVRAAYEDGSALYLRWSPKGGSTGAFQFTTSAGYVTTLGYPVGEAGSGDPVLIEFTLKCASITKSVVA